MPPTARPATTLVGLRIQERRQALQISQMQLGVLAGVDESSASVRINQYERGKHLPDLQMAKRLADALQVPMAYLYCDDPEIAEVLRLMHGMSKAAKKRLIAAVSST
jgi:transcriptional regulator with XRE-family HTH domain